MQEPINVPRRLKQLDNDVHSIYELLAVISTTQAQHGARLDGIDGRLDGIDRRLDAMDARFDGVDGRLDGMDEKLDAVLEILQAGGR